MKNLIASIVMALSMFCAAQQIKIPAEPVGQLTASTNMIQEKSNGHVNLSWHIIHPSSIKDVANILPPATIYLLKDTYVSIRILGASSKERGETEVSLAVNGNTFNQLFYGSELDVEPQYSAYIKKLNKYSVIDVGFRSVEHNQWQPFQSSRHGMKVLAYKNGDILPIETFIKVKDSMPYLAPCVGAGGRIKIGPMDVLMIADLGKGNVHKDAAALITLSSAHPNNGHGNNLDGVDPSNPGNGVGGPTGAKNNGSYEDIELK